jgi:hypothetical protein
MFRSYDHHHAENILLSRTTQLTTDPLFYKIPNTTVIVRYILLRVVDMLLLRATFFLRCLPPMYSYLRRSACPYSSGCNLYYKFSVVVYFFNTVLRLFCSSGVYLVLLHSAVLCCAVSRFLVELCIPVCLCGTCDQILFPVGMLHSEICCLVSMGRLL